MDFFAHDHYTKGQIRRTAVGLGIKEIAPTGNGLGYGKTGNYRIKTLREIYLFDTATIYAPSMPPISEP